MCACFLGNSIFMSGYNTRPLVLIGEYFIQNSVVDRQTIYCQGVASTSYYWCLPSPFKTAQPAGLDRSACDLAPSVITMGVA